MRLMDLYHQTFFFIFVFLNQENRTKNPKGINLNNQLTK